MASESSIVIKGLNQVHARLAKMYQAIPDEMGQALRAEAEIEMTEAKKRTPVLTGVLRASGHVTGPFREGNIVTVKLIFGGPAAPYAIHVHEDLEAFHKVGQAKFLESVLNESAKYLADRVGRRMALNKQG